jgi:hypothetical protein
MATKEKTRKTTEAAKAKRAVEVRPEVEAAIARIKGERKEIGKVRSALAGTLWSGQLNQREGAILKRFCTAYGFDAARQEVVILGGQPYPQVFALMRKCRENKEFSHIEERPIVEGDPLFAWARDRPGVVPEGECYWLCIAYFKNPHAFKLIEAGKDLPAEMPLFREYMGLGRAHPDTIQMSTMKANVLEMAQSRARGRALRFALDITVPSLEEMATEDLRFEDIIEADFEIPEASVVDGELGEGERPDGYAKSASKRKPDPEVSDVAQGEDKMGQAPETKPAQTFGKPPKDTPKDTPPTEAPVKDALDTAMEEKGLTAEEVLSVAVQVLQCDVPDVAALENLPFEARDVVAASVMENF